MELEKDTTTDRLMSTDEAAKRLGTSPNMMGKLIKYNIIPHIDFGRVSRVPCHAFDKFVMGLVGKNVHDLLREHEAG